MESQKQFIRDNIKAIAEYAFPDNTDSEWIIHEIIEHQGSLIVEVEPQPEDIGYARFRFTIVFMAPDKPHITQCHCLDEFGSWGLLFSD